MTGSGDPSRLVQFLLGSLPEAEHEEMEARLFTDEQLRDELACATDDLIHAYLREGLSREQRERFETHFLASGRHRARLALIRDLGAAVAGEAVAPSRPARSAWPRGWGWAAAASILIAVAGVLWLLRARPDPGRPLQGFVSPTAAVEPRPSARPSDGEPVRIVRLPARPQRPATDVALPAAARTVRIEIATEEEGPPSYDVTIRDAAGREVWRAEAVLPDSPGEPLVLEVPADRLASAEYDLVVDGEVVRDASPSAAPRLRYRLRIVRDAR